MCCTAIYKESPFDALCLVTLVALAGDLVTQKSNYVARKYGYLIWINDYQYKGRTIEVFFLAGNGGQIVMGVPELDLVVAFYGGSYSDHKGTYLAQDEYVPNFILPAVE